MKIKNFIKKIPGINSLSKYIFDLKLMKQFMKCNELELQQLKFYSQFIKPNDLVFDVGANVGNRSKIFLNLGANVCAYEPQSDLCNHLNVYLKRNKFIKIHNLGLGTVKSTETIRICEGDAHVLSSMSHRWIENTKQSGRFKDYQWSKSEIVNISTLDLEIEKYGVPRFIKIDVEGYELNVLKGLSQPVPALSFEFTAEEVEEAINCMQYLDQLTNYSFRLCLAEEFDFVSTWQNLLEMKSNLQQICKNNYKAWGDIYAVCTDSID